MILKSLFTVLGLVATPLYGQDSTTPGSAGGCWRGHPAPQCDAFLITEFGFYRSEVNPSARYTVTYRNGGTASTVAFVDRPADWKFSSEVGGMINRGRQFAVGATALLDTGPDGASVGVKARYRRWLTPGGLALDVGAGVRTSRDLVPNDSVVYGTSSAPGRSASNTIVAFTGDVALNAMDYVAIVSRVDVVQHGGKRQPVVAVGVRAQSRAGLFAAAGTLVTFALAKLVISTLPDS